MLYYLFDWLARDVSAFNVFRYLTFRGILGVLTAIGICFVIGPAVIRAKDPRPISVDRGQRP